MRILVISRNPWDDTNSVGNTLTNFFHRMKDVEFASIYFRSSPPNNPICKRYFHVSEAAVLKNWFRPEKNGRAFSFEQHTLASSFGHKGTNEKKIIHTIQRYGLRFAYRLSDYLWYSEKWINNQLKDFVQKFSPDIVFSFVKSAPQYYLMIKYLRDNFRTPLLTWIADDEYTGQLNNGSRREIENLRYILKESSVVWGCSREICEYYNSVFNCNATPLYKGCDLEEPIRAKKSDSVRIVYAGNLLYGRLNIIRKIAEALEVYTGYDVPVSFEIYSNTPLSVAEIEYFGLKRNTKYMGQRDYAYIRQMLADADVVLHVESFDACEILKTRYSFSTKIIDCLQSGSVLLAIGPKDIASIEYVRQIPGACVIDDLETMDHELALFIADASSFNERAASIRLFAHANHDATVNSHELERTFKRIVMEDI